MGNMLFVEAAAKAANSSSGGANYTFLILILAVFGVFYFIMIRPQRNRQRQAQQMQRDVMPGQRVRTTAGMYATVTSVEDSDVMLEVAPGVEVRYLRRAIMEVLPGDSGFGAPASPMGDTGSGPESAGMDPAGDGRPAD